MLKRSSNNDDIKDVNELATSMVKGVTNYAKNPYAVALGRLGGKKGGPARARKLSAERRKEIAKNAAHARWESRSGQ